MEPFTYRRGAAAISSPDDGAPFFDLELSAPPEDDENVSTCAVDGGDEAELDNGSEPKNPKAPQFQVLIKSANKIRVLMSGFKKSKQSTSEKTEQPHNAAAETKDENFFTARLGVEEVPIRSLFAGDDGAAANKAAKPQKQSIAVHKYLKKAKLRFSGKNLGNIRSPAVSASPAAAKGRDDSVAQQDDGIQSAILHCKSSFNASPLQSRPRSGAAVMTWRVTDELIDDEAAPSLIGTC